LSQILSLTFVHCNWLNSIRAIQTGLWQSQTLSQTSRHVEMVCVCDFHDLCRQNGIWAKPKHRMTSILNTQYNFQ